MTTIPQETKELGAEFWNSNPCGGAWPIYREFFAWYQRTEPDIYRVLDQHDWRGLTVLEVGCGKGTVLNYLPGKGATVHGIDMSADSIAQAEAGAMELGHRDRVTFRVADAEALPFGDSSYARIVSIDVLHHTPDTAKAVREVYRVLSPGGTAIVMLYRKGNPKWWATVSLRAASRLLDRIRGRSGVLVERLRENSEDGSAQGTALLELFGVPVLNAFSNRESREMFAQFSEVRITNHQPGFERLCDILPWLGAVRRPLAFIDRLTYSVWGFYQVIEARK